MNEDASPAVDDVTASLGQCGCFDQRSPVEPSALQPTRLQSHRFLKFNEADIVEDILPVQPAPRSLFATPSRPPLGSPSKRVLKRPLTIVSDPTTPFRSLQTLATVLNSIKDFEHPYRGISPESMSHSVSQSARAFVVPVCVFECLVHSMLRLLRLGAQALR
jgi:hypothetical protein